MSKVIYENLLGGTLLPTFMRLQMADQTIRFPEGDTKDILVKIQDEYAPSDFVILDNGVEHRCPRHPMTSIPKHGERCHLRRVWPDPSTVRK